MVAKKSPCEDAVASRFHTDEYVTVHNIFFFVSRGGDYLWELLTLLKTEQKAMTHWVDFFSLHVCIDGAVEGALCKSQKNG